MEDYQSFFNDELHPSLRSGFERLFWAIEQLFWGIFAVAAILLWVGFGALLFEIPDEVGTVVILLFFILILTRFFKNILFSQNKTIMTSQHLTSDYCSGFWDHLLFLDFHFLTVKISLILLLILWIYFSFSQVSAGSSLSVLNLQTLFSASVISQYS